MLKKNKGITLVALVITIIVLLILAGVSISLVLGENGILGKATKSSTATKIGQITEGVQRALASLYTDFLDEKYVKEEAAGEFKDWLDKDKLVSALEDENLVVDASFAEDLATGGIVGLKNANQGITIGISFDEYGQPVTNFGSEFQKLTA